MENSSGLGRHPWSWIRWVGVGLFVLLWIPSAFDVRFAWLWMGYAGLLTTSLGLAATFAPNRVQAFHRTYIP